MIFLFSNGKKNGSGTWLGINGDKYQGEWTNDIVNGKGKLISANGSIYDGEWRHGKKSGKGKFINNNGSTYEGIFINDSPSFQNLLPNRFCESPSFNIEPSAPPLEDEFIQKYN